MSHIAQSLLDLVHTVVLVLRGGKAVSCLVKKLHQSIVQVSSSNGDLFDGMRNSISLIDRHSVRNPVSAVYHSSSGLS